MDKKISELPVAVTVSAVDVIPIVASNINRKVSIGTLIAAAKAPVVSNLVPTVTGVYAIPLTSSSATIIQVPGGGSYTLADGVDGQNITIFAISPTTVAFNAQTATFATNGLLELIFLNSDWQVKSATLVTF
jgi:hypothetical protein